MKAGRCVVLAALATACVPRLHVDSDVKPELEKVSCVAILPFDDTTGTDNADGDRFADLLAARLANTGRFGVLDRSEGAKLLEMRGIVIPPTTDPDEVKVLGDILGVDAVLVGEVRRYEVGPAPRAHVDVAARLVEVQSGKDIWAGRYKGDALPFLANARATKTEAGDATAALMAQGLAAYAGNRTHPKEGPCWRTELVAPEPTPTPEMVVAIVSTPTPAPTPELRYIVIDQTKKQIELRQMVHFKTDTATFQGDPAPILDEIVSVLKANPQMEIRIEGYTDSRGSPVHNLTLSQARANAIRDYLVVNGGLDVSRLTALGLGMQNPISNNRTAEGRALNRRVEFHITKQ